MYFFFILSSIVIIAWAYIWKSVVMPSKLPKRWHWLCAVVLGLALLIQLGMPFILRSGLVSKHVSPFSITFGILGFIDLLAFYAICKDVAFFVWKSLSPNAVDPDRRLFVQRALNLAAVGLATGSTAIGTQTALADPEIKNVTVRIKDLHPDLVGLKIAQISDLHIGSLIHRAKVKRIVDKTNSLNPDFIMMTGDVADGPVDELKNAAAPLKALRSKFGNFYVTGNHEYYWDVDDWTRQMIMEGFSYLYNEHSVIKVGGARVLIGGVADYSCKRVRPDHFSSPLKSIEGAPSTDFKILLAHQPKSCWEANQAGYNLQLSGHTHNGQFFPNNLFIGFFHPYSKGLNLHRDSLWVYVSAGSGFWGPPQRFGIPAEITCLTLGKA